MKLEVAEASEADIVRVAALRNAAGEDLARRFRARVPCVSEAAVKRGLSNSRVLVARSGDAIVATLRLATKKPWAIDVSYFTAVERAIYLHDMAVDPARQRQGVGRALVDEAKAIARSWPAKAIRLDAYDAPHGAGGFYARCGFREVGRVTYRKTPLIYFEALLVA